MNDGKARPSDEISILRDVPECHDIVEPSFAPEPKPGQLLDGRFKIVEALSRSGMATIFKADDTQNQNQVVAVKLPHLRLEANPGFFDRFKREEEIGLMLNHPYLLKFIPVEHKSRPYIVTEYVRGCTLAHLMDAQRPLSEKDALKIAAMICEALLYLHERGIVHRDLKPGNVMICRDRTIRLLDFGIATNANYKRITVSHFSPAMGTPDYMAPEQVKNGTTDERTDIYGLGTILYEMLTGVSPFQNDNPWVAMNNRVTGDPVAPRKINPAISTQAEEIVLHALQRNPADRYSSVAAMKAELNAPRTVVVTGYSNRLQTPRWRISMQGTPVIAGSLLALGFIALQVVVFLLFRHFLKH